MAGSATAPGRIRPKATEGGRGPGQSLFIYVALGWFATSALFSATPHWPQFRGVDGAGVAAASAKPPVKFGPTENVRWSVAVPWSPSSPCIWGDRIFLTTFDAGQLEVRCYDRADGKLRWTQRLKPEGIEEFHNADGSPAASTPATDGRHVVSYFGSFGLLCHDFEGREVWRRPLALAQSGGKFGSGTSPVIVGNRVLLNRDQYQDSSLLALDLLTGAIVWETPRPEAAGSFGTPVIWRSDGEDQIVLGGSAQLKGYAFQSGAERWVINGVTNTVCTTPVIGDGRLFFAAWSPGQSDAPRQPWEKFIEANDKNRDGVVDLAELDPRRRDYLRGMDRNRDGKFTPEDWELLKITDAKAENVLIAVNPGGRGNISDTHVAWKYRKGLPYVASPLLYEGRIYILRDGGLLSSLDPKTGEPFYAQERIGATGSYYASPVAADGRIYVASLPGKLTVIKAGGAKPKILHQVDFGARILATPALVEDAIYVRTATHLWAFGGP